MKQITQNYKTGELNIDEIPLPNLEEEFVLIENKFSLISAGTEKRTIDVAKASLIGKAKRRPEQVKQVISNIKKEGFIETYKKVTTKLDSLAALGYSSSGIVLESLDSDKIIMKGNRVACAGQNYASHAEVISVPKNLVVKIPSNVSLEEASFTTLGAIAMQSVRQSNSLLGENIGVIGLGLLGHITCQILKANGCNVIGIDVSERMVKLAKKLSTDLSILRDDSKMVPLIENFTNGFGLDKIIITAATKSNDPILLASELLRKKGEIIIVGDVPMKIPREPHFYKKELGLKMSTSYGPGRYDIKYEKEGIDYPYSYVRWTEKRNMESFLKLLSSRRIDVKPLISHIFDINDATKAYDLITGKRKEDFIGILLRYSENEDKNKSLIHLKNEGEEEVNIGFIGAGSYAQSYLIPKCKKWGSLDTVVTKTGISSRSVADKFGFNSCSTNIEDILNNQRINTCFIATLHNTHTNYTIKSLKAGKHVFVEKPLALTIKELEQVSEEYQKSQKYLLMVGFNRRFAPSSQKLKSEFMGLDEPMVINYRVNAGFIPKDHWIQSKQGGGRIIGEICHFVDLMQYFTDAKPVSVFANCIAARNEMIKNDDNIAIIIEFSDGSIGNIVYTANGDKGLPKERVEIYSGHRSGIINNFQSVEIYINSKKKKYKIPGKGQKEEVFKFLQAIKNGSESPISFESIYNTTLTTFKILDSLKTGQKQLVD